MSSTSELDTIIHQYGPRLTDLTAASIAWMRLNDDRYCDIPKKSLLGDQRVQAKQDVLNNPKINTATTDLIHVGLKHVYETVKFEGGTEEEMHTNLINIHRSCVVSPDGGLQFGVDAPYTEAWCQSNRAGTAIPSDSEIWSNANTTYKGWSASTQVPTLRFSSPKIRESLLEGEDSCVDAIADKLSRRIDVNGDTSKHSQLKSYLKHQISSFQSQRWANDLGGQDTPNRLRFESTQNQVPKTMQFFSADGYLDGLVLPEPLNLEDLGKYSEEADSTVESIF